MTTTDPGDNNHPRTSSISREKVEAYIKHWIPRKIRRTKAWSFVHHASAFSVVILSFAAAGVLKIGSLGWTEVQRADIATVFSLLAGIIGGIAASGAFAQKWRTNRLTRSKLEVLELELMDDQTSLVKVLEDLKDMKLSHDIAVVNEPPLRDK